jgi:hypothetical protein
MCIKPCVKLGNITMESYKMLECAFKDEMLHSTRTFE